MGVVSGVEDVAIWTYNGAYKGTYKGAWPGASSSKTEER